MLLEYRTELSPSKKSFNKITTGASAVNYQILLPLFFGVIKKITLKRLLFYRSLQKKQSPGCPLNN